MQLPILYIHGTKLLIFTKSEMGFFDFFNTIQFQVLLNFRYYLISGLFNFKLDCMMSDGGPSCGAAGQRGEETLLHSVDLRRSEA